MPRNPACPRRTSPDAPDGVRPPKFLARAARRLCLPVGKRRVARRGSQRSYRRIGYLLPHGREGRIALGIRFQGIRVSNQQDSSPDSGADNSFIQHKREESFVDAAVIAAFLRCSRKHVLRLSALGKIPAHPLPGSSKRKTWRYLLSEVRNTMLSDCTAPALGLSSHKAVTSVAGSPRKGGR